MAEKKKEKRYSDLHLDNTAEYYRAIHYYVKTYAEEGGHLIVLTTPVMKEWLTSVAKDARMGRIDQEDLFLDFDTAPFSSSEDFRKRIAEDKRKFGGQLFLVAEPTPVHDLEEIGDELGVYFSRPINDSLS